MNNQTIVMRQEVLEDGSALPLVGVLDSLPGVATIYDTEIVAAYENASNELAQLFTESVPGISVAKPSVWDTDDEKESIVGEVLNGVDVVTVTLDSFNTTGAYPLGVSRHFSPEGEFLGIGKRPGYPDLSTQIKQMSEFIGTSSVAMLEDDIFTGSTAEEIINKLIQAGITVEMFVTGTQVSAVDEIAGVPIYALEKYPDGTVLDIVDPRDMLFGLDHAGLVISDRGTTYRAPYLAPFIDIKARASVPQNKIKEFSLGVVATNKTLFESIEGYTGSAILLEHLSIPFRTFVQSATDYDSCGRVLDFCEYVQQLILNGIQ